MKSLLVQTIWAMGVMVRLVPSLIKDGISLLMKRLTKEK